jgi:hypothetical protein
VDVGIDDAVVGRAHWPRCQTWRIGAHCAPSGVPGSRRWHASVRAHHRWVRVRRDAGLVGGMVGAEVLVVAEQHVVVHKDDEVHDVRRAQSLFDLGPDRGVQLEVLRAVLRAQPDADPVPFHHPPAHAAPSG